MMSASAAPESCEEASTPRLAPEPSEDGAAPETTVTGGAADGAEDGIVLEVGADSGVTINAQSLTMHGGKAVIIQAAPSADAQKTVDALTIVPTSASSTVQVEVAPAPVVVAEVKRWTPLARVRKLFRRPQKPSLKGFAKSAAVAVAVPCAYHAAREVLGMCRRALIARRMNKAMQGGQKDVMVELLTSKSALVRCAAISCITSEAHRCNAEQLWVDGAFASVPERQLTRSMSTALPRTPSMSAPKPEGLASVFHSAPLHASPLGLFNSNQADAPPPTPGNASASENGIYPPRRQGSGETFLSRFDVVAANGHAEATSAAVSATALSTLSDMLRSRSPGVVKAACKCVQELAFSGDVLAQKLVTMGVVPQLVYLMRDRNGTRHRAFATLRQGDRPQRRIVGPEELLQLTGFSLPLVSFSTKQRVVTLTPRGFSWSTFRARMPWRLQERSTVRREIRDVASEALQNLCALRSGAKEMLACGGMDVIVDTLWTTESFVSQLAAVETVFSVVSHFPNCRNLVYSLAGDYALRSVANAHKCPLIVQAACVKTLVKLQPERSLLPSDINDGGSMLYR